MKSRLYLAGRLLAACAAAMAASAAHADITVFTDRTAFFNAVSDAATDSFDNLPIAETAGPLRRMAGPYAYQAGAGHSSASFYPSGSSSDIWLSGKMAGDTITFNAFSSTVFGFGGNFFGTDSFGAFMPGRTIVFSAVAGADEQTFTLSNAGPDSFVAFVSDHPLTSVSFHNLESDGTVYWAAANNVVLAVPEPAAWSMLLGGLGIGGLVRRRSSRSNRTKATA